MAKRKRFRMGWFGWTFTSVITVTLIASAVFFFNLFDLGPMTLFNSDDQATEADDMSEEDVEHLEEVRGTVGQKNQDIGQFVSDTHDFYNETTGYGGISSLDWDEQRKEANAILEILDEELPDVEDGALQEDLEHIQELANAVMNEEDSSRVRSLHRIFHDLDIALNDYNTYDKIWNATETLNTTN
ncbi:hypothetical protein SAMN04488072_11363 [Lentibacillus halodurans]|uniref:Uncharacterized protein n=1 Tax=Lentibacillus halodurans TaxID=237679 RepID=A0A1I0ZTR9_9BACI|nr:hypothetical protein [Lentibacillus halodurans]SFB28921.1 hypothetical protein SAMN04488072_11363 [Lentibacillus halodurans]